MNVQGTEAGRVDYDELVSGKSERGVLVISNKTRRVIPWRVELRLASWIQGSIS